MWLVFGLLMKSRPSMMLQGTTMGLIFMGTSFKQMVLTMRSMAHMIFLGKYEVDPSNSDNYRPRKLPKKKGAISCFK